MFMKKSSKIIIIVFILIGIVTGCILCVVLLNKDEPPPITITQNQTALRIEQIRQTPNTKTENVEGNIYYISNTGDDDADGKSPQTAWKTLSKLQFEFSNSLQNGDCVLFNRGDVFRGNINVTKDNITLGAYGDEGKPKPEINISPYNAATEGTWVQVEPNIWKFSEKISSDIGVIWFFKEDNSLSNSHEWSDYSYEFGQKISFDSSVDEATLDLSATISNDLEFYHFGRASSGINTGEYVYLYSTTAPQLRFDEIEFSVGVNGIYGRTNLVVDNLKIVFAGNHAVGTGSVANLTVSNCEFGYIGGSRQNQNNVRFGNAIEIYGQVNQTNGYEVEDGFLVDNNYIYEVYDAGITFQYTATSSSTVVEKARILNNVVEKCNYSVEYWNVSSSTAEDKDESYIKNFSIQNNIFRFSGSGVSQTRPDKGESAHIKTWKHDADYENKVIGSFDISNNIFYSSSEQMLSIYACDEASMPNMKNNEFFNSEEIPLGYFYNKGISKAVIPYVRSKMLQLLPGNKFAYTTDFQEKIISGTSHQIEWTLNLETGVLNIYGEGEMQDYSVDNLPLWTKYSDFVSKIIIGENITKLGEYSFYNLGYVEEININSCELKDLSYDKINFNNGNNYTFFKTGRKWYGIKAVFGENVTKIPSFLFWPSGTSSEAPFITEIKFIGNNISQIRNHALAGLSCESLEIPEGVTDLGVLAVSNSPTLKLVILPDSLTTLSAWCLAGNHSLEKVIIGSNINSLENNLFFSDVNLKQVIIKGDISTTSNTTDIFTNITSSIILYGNETVESFVQRYNQIYPDYQLTYLPLESF